jgi:FKBP-type peptidyl-prolyl cis-trans isomerase FkpA
MQTFLRVSTAALLSISALGLAACGSDGDTGTSASGGVTELQVQELRLGNGAEATNGKVLSVRYTGWLYDQRRPENKGNQFDAGTYSFTLGRREVIAGWDQGVAGMKIGGQRRLTIPPQLAYGATGVSGVIPPNWTLVFDVELLDVR